MSEEGEFQILEITELNGFTWVTADLNIRCENNIMSLQLGEQSPLLKMKLARQEAHIEVQSSKKQGYVYASVIAIDDNASKSTTRELILEARCIIDARYNIYAENKQIWFKLWWCGKKQISIAN